MRWIDDSSEGGEWQGLRLTVPGPARRAPLMIEAAPRRVRLSWGGQPRLWTCLDADHGGLQWACAPAPLHGLPPLGFQTARAVGAGLPAWARHYARQLEDQLEAGDWALAPPWAPGQSPQRRAPPIYGLTDVPRLGSGGPLDWGMNGSAEVLPLRAPSPPDSGRVKAWRRWAREAPLPPVLLCWITGLDAHVVLDGHDRLQAADAEGVTLEALTLMQQRPSGWDRGPWQAAAQARYLRAEAGGARPGTLRTLQAEVVSAFDSTHDTACRTRAWPLRGGVAEWTRSLPAGAAGARLAGLSGP